MIPQSITSEIKNKIIAGLSILAAVLLICLFFSVRSCTNRSNDLSGTQSYSEASDSVRNPIVRKLDAATGDTSASVNTAQITQNNLTELQKENEVLKKKLANYSSVSSFATVKTETHIHDTLKYPVPIPCYFKPFTVIKDTNNLRISTTIMQDELVINDWYSFNEQTTTVGQKKSGLFRKANPITFDIENSNRNMRVIGASHTEVVPYKYRYGISIYAGYGITKTLKPLPSLGLALTYNLIQF